MDKETIDEAIWASLWPYFLGGLQENFEAPIQESPSYKAFYNELTYYRELETSPFSNEFLELMKANFLPYKYFIRPRLPWKAIDSCLKDFAFQPGQKDFLIMKLTVGNIENAMKIMELVKDGKKRVNQGLKQLPSVVRTLDNLQICTPEELAAFRNKIKMLQTFRDVLTHTEDFIKKMYHLDKKPKIRPQKHKYWNTIVSQTIEEFNALCHDADLCNNPCRKTHSKAIRTVAKLLTIIHPTIWTEEVKTIANRIKQKDYRNIS